MSSPKAKARGVNQQVKARLSAVRDFLAGRTGEAKLVDVDDEKAREIVKAELLAAMSGRDAAEADQKRVDESGAQSDDSNREIEAGDMRQDDRMRFRMRQPETAQHMRELVMQGRAGGEHDPRLP